MCDTELSLRSRSVATMAFLLNKTSIASGFRSQPQKTEGAFALQRRGFHVELGAREKALLAEDPALMRFKSDKNTIRRIRKVGDALTIVVLAGCCYEIYVRTVTRVEARKQAVGRQ